ncbi:MAG TPA: hypothetical protein VMV44_15760 [Rectinemataceae bacterium]|nr:hypothetical protein [Rectinemataceae bacterium]
MVLKAFATGKPTLSPRRIGFPWSALLVLPGGGYQRDWRALPPLHRIVFEEAAWLEAKGRL